MLTAGLVVVCILAFVGFQTLGSTGDVRTGLGRIDGGLAFDLRHAVIPCEVLTGEPLSFDEVIATYRDGDVDACRSVDEGPELYPSKLVYLAALTSLFLHGGWAHLGGNMLFLWIFGNNIEDRLGHVRFALFYLAGGLVATAGHVLAEPSSTVPLVGASGAIAAVMGAYLVWYPRARVLTLIPPIFVLPVRAQWFLLIWFVVQFFTSPTAGVAWVAHVGGFAFGSIVALIVGRPDRAAPPASSPPSPWGEARP